MRKRWIFIFTIFVSCSKLFGQTNLDLEYSYSREFQKSFFATIKLNFPDKRIEQLYSDTSKSFHAERKDYFKVSGEYCLKVNFIYDKRKDSTEYMFKLNGNETDISISISFGCNQEFVGEKRLLKKSQKIVKGYISVVKYYNTPKSIQIKYIDLESSEYYKGPFFRIFNNSRDTIYGEYLPGYFGEV